MNSYSVLFFAAAAFVAVSGSAVYPSVHLGPVTTQYHSQDEHGQYAYGYSGGPSAKHEQRTADGVTRGGYSYVDANGIVQSLAYVSDPVNGFRVSGTNLPADKVPVAPAPHYPAAVPVVHDAVLPVVAPAAPVHHVAAAPAPLPTVVDARHLALPYSVPVPALPAVPVAHPIIKLAQPLTPAGTSNLHYPEHAVLYGRRKRSAGLYPYPLVSGYAAPHPAPAHVVTVKHTEFVAPPAPVVHHVAAPAPYVYTAPAPVATSYTSVVRHDSPSVYAYAAPAPVVKHYAPVPAPVVPVVKAYAPAPVIAPAPILAPAPVIAPVAPVAVAAKSQFHAQDEHGQYTYGYTDGASAKTETRYADGQTKGSYSYVDDTGSVQAVHYTAGADGFKAAGTTIPVHHV